LERFSRLIASIVAGSAESLAFSGMKGDEHVILALRGNELSEYLIEAMGYEAEQTTFPKSLSNIFAEVSPSFFTNTAKPESTGESGRYVV
jgi:hypothetical protein